MILVLMTTKPSTSKACRKPRLAKLAGSLASELHIVCVLARLAVALARPLSAALVLILATSAAFLARLRAVDVHVVWVLLALAQLCPVLAVDVVIVPFVLALIAGNRAAN